MGSDIFKGLGALPGMANTNEMRTDEADDMVNVFKTIYLSQAQQSFVYKSEAEMKLDRLLENVGYNVKD